MTIASTISSNASITPKLVGDLRAAEHRDERVLRLVAQTEQDVDFLLQQAPHGRGHPLRWPDDRCVRSVGRAERIVDVAVDAVDQLIDERRARCRSRPDRTGGSRAARRPGASSASRARTGAIEYFGVGSPFGPTEVTRADDARAASGQPLDGWKRGADPEVVEDLNRSVVAMVERNVEVGAYQDALARQVTEPRLQILQAWGSQTW